MRKLIDLNREELKKVFEVNTALQNGAMDALMDNVDFWNKEYLDCWKKGIDYRIGWDRGAFFKCTDKKYFIDGLKKAQETFCFLDDGYNETIAYVEKLLNKLGYLYYNSSCENYERVENRIDELVEKLEEACFRRFMDEYEYCFDFDNQFEHFFEIGMDCLFYSESFLVNDDFELFEEVHYIKRYE